MATGDAHADQVLDFKYGDNRHTDIPATVYMTLYYESPDDSGGGTEVDYAGFARVAIDNDDVSWAAAADREKVLQIEVEFAEPAADTDPIVAWAIHSHITNDEIMDWEEFSTPIGAAADEPLTIEAGSIIISLISGI